MPLHIEFRPKDFDEIVGNRTAVSSLKNIFDKPGEKPHAYLIKGPTGCGKTTIARIISTRLGCEKNLTEINAANNRGIDTIRELIDIASYKPMAGSNKMYLMDECHALSKDAQNALLKILEEPPKHVFFALCTTEPDKLLPTIRNRCSTFEVGKLRPAEIMKLLKRANVPVEDSLLTVIARKESCPRQALILLEQVQGLSVEEAEKAIKNNLGGEKQVIDLCRALLNKESWKRISSILKGLDEDPEKIRRAILKYVSSVMLNKEDAQAVLIFECFKDNFYNTGKAGLVFACYEAVE